DGRRQAHLVPAEVRHRLLAHIGHAHAGDDGEGQRRIDERSAELAAGAVDRINVQRMLVHREKREPDVVGLGERAPGPVLVHLAHLELLVIASGRLAETPGSYFLCTADHKRIRRSMIERLLGDIVGAANVLTDPKDTQPYLTDWRRQYSGTAMSVVRPANTAEVARVVEACAREKIAIVPQGGNTGLSGGATPTGKGREIVLSLTRLNRIRALDRLNDTLTVEAGCVLANV